MDQKEAVAQQLARRVIERERPDSDQQIDRASAAALAADEMYAALSRWVGAEGCHALFARARRDAENRHPPLARLSLQPHRSPYIGGLADSVEAHGPAATAEAIEAFLAGMIDLLGRLIGLDMATNLIERSLSASVENVASTDKRRAEA